MREHSMGKTIASLRKSKGWTQVELAEKLNVSDKAVSKWESGVGFPEISQFPAMAALFGVTIDYLMTGKAAEKEIVTISKAELCAKNDDISLAEKVKDLPNDESNKNIVDYILQYQSLNVFKRLCEIDPKFIKRFKMLDAITLAVVSNSLSLLVGKEFYVDRNCRFTFENADEIKSLLPVEDKEYFRNYQDQCSCLIPREFFTMLVTDKRIGEDTFNTLLSNQNGRECVWYHAFPYMIDEAYKNDNRKLLRRLLDISRQNNAVAYEKIEPIYNSYDCSYNYILNYFFVARQYGNNGYGLVRILESTIKTALEKGEFDMVDEFNDINISVENFVKTKFGRIHNDSTKCYIANADEIRIAKLKLDKSISKTDLQVQASVHNGIISIKELKETANFATIKKALYEYPIHPFELLYQMYQQEKWRELFELSVDFVINGLSDSIMRQDKKGIEDAILGSWTNDNQQPYNHMKKLCINNEELYVSRRDISYGRQGKRDQKCIQEVANYLSTVRKRIIDELANKFDKDRITGELTKDYFYSELSKGNRDIVIIKLCVRMEAILKCDYNYEGDFSEMLNRFCGQFDAYDDESNNYDPYTPAMLNRLRCQRNSIVHSEKVGEPMTDDEIKKCIDYICSL